MKCGIVGSVDLNKKGEMNRYGLLNIYKMRVVKKVLGISIWFAMFVFLSTMGCVPTFNHLEIKDGSQITGGYFNCPITTYPNCMTLKYEIGKTKIGRMPGIGLSFTVLQSLSKKTPPPYISWIDMKLQFLNFGDSTYSMIGTISLPPGLSFGFKRNR